MAESKVKRVAGIGQLHLQYKTSLYAEIERCYIVHALLLELFNTSRT